jgi:hypothetical protein
VDFAALIGRPRDLICLSEPDIAQPTDAVRWDCWSGFPPKTPNFALRLPRGAIAKIHRLRFGRYTVNDPTGVPI